MLYILGGAPRVGKTIIAQEFLERAGVPVLSLDLLKMSVVKGIPEYGLDPERPSDEIARKLWPVVKGFSETVLENGRDYLLEGHAILPRHARELADEFPGEVRACFVGFEQAVPDDRLAIARQHPGPEDWLMDYADQDAQMLFKRMIAFSRLLREGSEREGFSYIESQSDFDDFKEKVLRYLETGQR